MDALDDRCADSDPPSRPGGPKRMRANSPLDEHPQHIVQFYDTTQYILNVLTNFIAPILSSKDAAVVIAVKFRLEALHSRLRDRGISVEEKLATGQLSMIDAHEMLGKLWDVDNPTPISIEPISLLLIQLGKKFPRTYVYGELVNILCAQGDHPTAVGLEKLWNELVKRHKLTLLCGYDMDNFKEEHLHSTFEDVCGTHSRIAPTEMSTAPRDSDEKTGIIARLRQKAKALETEVARRRTVEGVLYSCLEVLSTRAEESLRSQQKLYRTLLSILPVGVYSAPVTPDIGGVIVNERFCELAGLTEANIRIYGWLSAVHADDRDRVRHLCDVSGKRGKEDYRFRHLDGTVRWVTGETVDFITHEERNEIYVHTIVDITELKKMEKEREIASLKAKELLRHRAEHAERHKSEQDRFIDTLCHELRNPLSSIQGNIELLQMGQALRRSILSSDSLSCHDLERLREQGRCDDESLSAIEKCAAHQKVITDDVLILSKLEVGKVVLRNVDFNPKTVIIDVAKVFEAEASRKGLSLRFNMPVSDVVVRGDPDRMSQVLINLLANALKFTTDGSITLGMDVLERKDGFLIKVVVKDTGIGLTTEEMAKLFHRFMQPASSTYQESGGSGLGLVISKNLVELMGGTMTVESVKGKGSEFSFTLLMAEAEHAQYTWPAISSQNPQLPRSRLIHRILIVEDNLINQRFLQRLLEAAGFVCSLAGNGSEALAHVQGNTTDLILMDIHMPIMDGISATREIRARETKEGRSPVPIVGLSGNAREEHKDAALGSGMNYYLTKPCKKDELYRVIDMFVT